MRTAIPAVVLFLLEASDLLLLLPKIRLLENRICLEHYQRNGNTSFAGGIDESLCKIQPVQARLASIRGWQVFFDAIPSRLFPATRDPSRLIVRLTISLIIHDAVGICRRLHEQVSRLGCQFCREYPLCCLVLSGL